MSTSDNKRIKYFLIIVIILYGGLVFRLFQKQILDHDHYLAMAQSQHQTVQELPAHRGKIFAKTEYAGDVTLATNQTYYQLLLVPKQIEDREGVIDYLKNTLDLDRKEVEEQVDSQKPYVPPIAHKLEYELAQEIAKEGYSGLYLLAEDDRFYPESDLACYITGYLNSDGEGQYGVEQYYDQILKGDLGLIKAQKDVYGRYISIYEKEEPRDGQNLYLTLDLTLQAKAKEIINQAVDSYGAESGSILILNPKTGGILASAHKRGYDPNNYSKEANRNNIDIFFDPTISAVYEPGSVMKPITMASALDAGRVKPETSHKFGAYVWVGENKIYNAAKEAYGEETMVEVLENSDNVGMVWVQRKLGEKKFHDYLQKFGFGNLTGVDLEGETSGNLLSYPSEFREVDAASNSFGQAISVTPIQMLTAFTPFINEGRLVQPHILESRENLETGEVVERQAKKTEPVISSKSADQITDMLISVVENGQGSPAQVEGYKIAGKTGTAQVANEGGYSETETIHNFIGYGPAKNPAFLMLVKIDKPEKVAWSSLSAAPTFSKMARFILNYYQIEPE